MALPASLARHWPLVRLVGICCGSAFVVWSLLAASIFAAAHYIGAQNPALLFLVEDGKPTLLLLVICFVGLSLTVAGTLTFALTSRLEAFVGWADRTTQLHRSMPEAASPEADLLGPAIRDVLAQACRAAQSYRRLSAIDQRITSSMKLEVILPEIVSSAVELLEATAGSVTLRDHYGSFRRTALHNLPSELMDEPLLMSHGLTLETVQRGEPVIVDDYSKYERRLALLDGLGFKAALGVPLISEGRTIGALAINTKDPARRFDKTDVELLSSFASQAAIAIRNVMLYSQNLQQMEELRLAKEELARSALQTRKLLRKTFKTEDESRSRMAAEFHDGITQMIVGALYQIQSISPMLVASSFEKREDALKRIDLAQGLLKQTVNEIYFVIHDLRPPYLDDIGLVPALERYLRNFQEVSEFECRLSTQGSEPLLNPGTRMAIYRIIQEALNNARKHSGAQGAEVSVEFSRDRVRVKIRDDGKGFDKISCLCQGGEHLGITTMEERADAVGGSLEIRSAPGHDTTVILTVPISAPDISLDEPTSPLSETDQASSDYRENAPGLSDVSMGGVAPAGA